MGWYVYDSNVLDSYTSFYEKLCLELPFWSHYRVFDGVCIWPGMEDRPCQSGKDFATQPVLCLFIL